MDSDDKSFFTENFFGRISVKINENFTKESLEEIGVGGFTPLILAVAQNEINVVKFLLDNGANLEAKSHQGDTALIIACSVRNHIEMVKILVYAGANVEEKNDKGRTALTVACIKNSTENTMENIKFLIEECGADLETTDNKNRNPILYLTPTDHKQIIDFIENLNMKRANIKPAKR
jgi:ankyrin repeat protein